MWEETVWAPRGPFGERKRAKNLGWGLGAPKSVSLWGGGPGSNSPFRVRAKWGASGAFWGRAFSLWGRGFQPGGGESKFPRGKPFGDFWGGAPGAAGGGGVKPLWAGLWGWGPGFRGAFKGGGEIRGPFFSLFFSFCGGNRGKNPKGNSRGGGALPISGGGTRNSPLSGPGGRGPSLFP